MAYEQEHCFSPMPREQYARGDFGHGILCRNLPVWNLCWLSFPSLDRYIDDEGMTMDGAMALVPPQVFGCVSGSAANEANFPGLCAALVQHPSAFLRNTTPGQWEDLPAYKLLGEAWVTTIRRRASLAAQRIAAGELASKAILKASGNVTHVQFGKRTAQ